MMVEDVLLQIKTLMDNHLPAELERQDGHAADGIICDKMQTVVFDQHLHAEGWPAMLIKPESMETVLYATGKKDARYEITIGVTVTDTDHERSHRKLWRTLRAAENVMEVFGPGSGPIVNYQTIGMEYEAALFNIDREKVVEKSGFIRAMVLERMTAYTQGQV